MEITSLAEQVLFTTSRVALQLDGASGSGTAFVFTRKVRDGDAMFLVTNKHVVLNVREGVFLFTKAKDGKPIFGEKFELGFRNFEKGWHGHPDVETDVCVQLFSPIIGDLAKKGIHLFIRSITQEQVPTTDQIANLDAIEDITVIGYPTGIFDPHNLIPIVRTGISATPIQLDYENRPKFLIDAAVFPGSSGSPVFILNRGGWADRLGNFTIGNRIYLLGILAAGFHHKETGEIEYESIPVQTRAVMKTPQMINLGVVFKTRTILEAIDDFCRTHGVPLA